LEGFLALEVKARQVRVTMRPQERNPKVRDFGLLAVLLALLLVLSGCPTIKPTDTGDRGAAPPVAGTTEAPDEAAGAGTTEEAGPAAPAEVETHPTAKVVALSVGDQFDEEKDEISNQTKTFTPETPVIYVSAGIKGLTKGEMVTGTLIAVDVTDSEGTQIRDHEVTFAELKAPGEESTMQFKFSAPTTGWPVGTYKVDIAGTGKLIETVEVTVEEGGSA
jgi:uncharacterized protein YceK